MNLRFWKKLKRDVRDGNEKGAREAVLQDLFNDFNRNRFTVYKFNFIRGIFFGFGSVLGGTILVSLMVLLLNWIGVLMPATEGFVNSIVQSVQRTTNEATNLNKQ